MDGNQGSMASWWGTQRFHFVMSRIQRAASAPHLAVVHQRWMEQVELLSLQAQALQQQCQTQQALLAAQAAAQTQAPPTAAEQHGANRRQPPNSQPPTQPQEPQEQEIQVMPAPEPSMKILPMAGGEELLRAVFSVVDTPSPDEIKALALQTGRSQGQVRSYFTKMRSSIQVIMSSPC
eukprot:1156703-Pelagomonas_calceolata.AAC.2